MSYVFDALQEAQRRLGKGKRVPWEESLASPLPAEYNQTATALDPFREEPDDTARLVLNPQPEHRLISLDPEHVGADRFRLLAGRLRLVQQETRIRRLLITSSVTGEGKSTIAANLAFALAQHGSQRTLLIDGDSRRPTVSSVLNCKSSVGLCEWLSQGGSVWPFVRRYPALPLWCMPAGKSSGHPHPRFELDPLSKALASTDELFSWVVIDSPPIAVLADATIWLGVAEACLLVARRGKTPKRMIKKALASIAQSKLLGIVLNDFSDSSQPYYQQYYSVTPK